jgi:hypothetical protein
MWMSVLDNGPWRAIDTVSGQITNTITNPANSYGVVVDRTGGIYYASWCNTYYWRLAPGTYAVTQVPFEGFDSYHCARGVAIDSAGDIWMAICRWNSGCSTTYGYRIKGGTVTKLGHYTVSGISAGVGIACDSYGKCWMTGTSSNSVSRINKDTGATELSTALFGSNPYNYSDWTGYALKTIVTNNGQAGYWTSQMDSGSATASWKKATWIASLPAGTSVRVRFRAAETKEGLSAAAWCTPFNTSPADLTTCAFPANKQRHLEAQVHLTSKDGTIQAAVSKLTAYWTN